MSDARMIYDGGTLSELVREVLAEGDAAVRAYLRQSWIDTAMAELWHARQTAQITQTELAARLGTTQSSIARLENDSSGGVSLRRFVDYALGCGRAPLALEFVSVSELTNYVLADPSAPRTAPAVGGCANYSAAGTAEPTAVKSNQASDTAPPWTIETKPAAETHWVWNQQDATVDAARPAGSGPRQESIWASDPVTGESTELAA
jgi:transcriptional regulator with XRE-family HTH domain